MKVLWGNPEYVITFLFLSTTQKNKTFVESLQRGLMSTLITFGWSSIAHLEFTVGLDLRTNAGKVPRHSKSQAAKRIRRAHSRVTPVYGNVCHSGLKCLSTNQGTLMGIWRLAFYPAKRMSHNSLFSPSLSFSCEDLTPITRGTMPAADRISRKTLTGPKTTAFKLL